MKPTVPTNYCYRGSTACNGLLGLAFCFVFVGLPCTTQAQGLSAFQNFDFESANLPSLPTNQFGSFVPISQAMPGWSAYAGDQSQNLVIQNNVSTGAAEISIFGPHYAIGVFGIISGNHTAALESGGSGIYVPATLSQTGLVPVGAESLQMKIGAAEANFSVMLGGQSLNMVPLQTGAGYILFGGTVPAGLAGQSATLSISSLPTATRPYNQITLDDITFSTSPVPEPGIAWLLFVGGATLGTAGRLAARAQRMGANMALCGAGEPNTFAA